MSYNKDLKMLKYVVFLVLVLYNVAELVITILPATVVDKDFIIAVAGLVLTDIYYLTLIWLIGSIAKLADKYYQLVELHRGESKLLKSAKEDE